MKKLTAEEIEASLAKMNLTEKQREIFREKWHRLEGHIQDEQWIEVDED